MGVSFCLSLIGTLDFRVGTSFGERGHRADRRILLK